jgi:T4 RnlA family RNA ligase
MKVRLPIEESYFNIVPNTFCGIDCYLITPQMDAKWSNDNLFFRSLIVDKEGTVLSSGWPKFFNYGEKPECYPSLDDYNDWRFVDKVDGTLVICDYINNQFSMRTRGTVTYATQNNAPDFELLPQKYPKVVEFLKENPHITLLFELVTPNNVIVVRPKEVDFYLLGAINKDSMSVVSFSEMTDIWRQVGPIQTPQTFTFSSTTKLSEIVQHIKNWKGKEGIVVSYNNNQNRIKLKSDWYCFIHRVKSQLNSTNNLIEFYVEKGMPSVEDFYVVIETEFDYEIAVQLKSEIEKICEAGSKAKKYIDNILEMVHDIRKVETRKEQAVMIKRNYNENSSYAFAILDNKEITKQQWFKLIENNL